MMGCCLSTKALTPRSAHESTPLSKQVIIKRKHQARETVAPWKLQDIQKAQSKGANTREKAQNGSDKDIGFTKNPSHHRGTGGRQDIHVPKVRIFSKDIHD